MSDSRLEIIEGKLDRLIAKFEVEQSLVSGFDARQAALEDLAKQLATTEKHLATTVMRHRVSPIAFVALAAFVAVLSSLVTARATGILARASDVPYSHMQEGP